MPCKYTEFVFSGFLRERVIGISLLDPLKGPSHVIASSGVYTVLA
jgi:hypothetical protein